MFECIDRIQYVLPMKKGFSLVELSIVLVILGLLVGGILAGKSLIRAAELRSVATEYQRFITATFTFRDKYFGLPGDITNAEALWGVADPVNATCITTPAIGTATCNGNGDGQIYSSTRSDERFRFWQQLANAGLIEGRYPGNTTTTTSIGNDIPRSRFGQTGWNAAWQVPWAGNSTYFRNDTGYNALFIGGETGAGTYSPSFLAEEAWNIDTKLDDGKPGRGTMIIQYYSYCTNAADKDDLAASYVFTKASPNNKCTPYFKDFKG